MNAFPHPAARATPAGAPTDLEAVQGVRGGQRDMFEVIVRRYNAQLYRVGMAYLRNHAQTEDAMQNAYLKAFLKLQHFEGTAAFSTWLTRIMINECLMLIRAGKKFTGEAPAPADGAIPAEAECPSRAFDVIDRQEVKSILERSIQTLPRSHRAVYILREVQQLSTSETAACLGLSTANVKVLLHRAREGLKERLLQTAEGAELFDFSAPFCDPMTRRVMAAVRALS